MNNILMKKLLIIIGITAIITGPMGCLNDDNNADQDGNNDNNSIENNKVESQTLPPSLDQYYTKYPSEYLIEMYKLGESMTGISVNIQQGDMDNAARSFEAFSRIYNDNIKLVPEWEKYYDQTVVETIGTQLESGDIPAVYEALGETGATCSGCHIDTMPDVYNKYYWDDFADINIETPKGPLTFKQGKMMYLLSGFDGIGINIKEADLAGAQQSYDQFKSMYRNMSYACGSCHVSEIKYYIDEDTWTLIDEMGDKINSGDPVSLSAAEGIRHQIGEGCHKCHIIHIPPQYAKVKSK
jgi:cytochrome c556